MAEKSHNRLPYELLILKPEEDKKGQPDLILRRAIPGEYPEKKSLELSRAAMSSEFLDSDLAKEEEIAELDSVNHLDASPVHNDTPPVQGTGEFEYNQATGISDYINSLTHHMPGDVRRIVDTIIAEEQKDEDSPEVAKDEPKQEEEEGIVEKRQIISTSEIKAIKHDSQSQEAILQKHQNKGNKQTFDLAQIFRSWGRARKKSTKKRLSYRKKVEYEDS